MSLNTPHSLPQCITAAMLMIRMRHLMFMKYDTGSHQWIFWIMYIPHMPCIPGHDGYIPVIHINNLKIPRIQTFKIFSAKHLLPPFQNALPMPSPLSPALLRHPSVQNTSHTIPPAVSQTHSAASSFLYTPEHPQPPLS